jgi:hypothetical protein
MTDITPQGLAARMPERIKAWPWNGNGYAGLWHVYGRGETAEYVLATPEALADHPAVRALVEAAEARGMERAAKTARFYGVGAERELEKPGIGDSGMKAIGIVRDTAFSIEEAIRAEAATIRQGETT